jgi:hypothetical protein
MCREKIVVHIMSPRKPIQPWQSVSSKHFCVVDKEKTGWKKIGEPLCDTFIA